MSSSHQTWKTKIDIEDEGRSCRAEARLQGKTSRGLVGEGSAQAKPGDEYDAAIGHELAAARALSDLSYQLLYQGARDIEAHTHQEVTELRER
ncbi:DUF1876 domain-containing protein [Streptomyces sp. JH002]|jgi:hypothetical protein|uniref:DUF1876 domain-containing protein n=1 Tax=Streptomyces xiamenensis TaxID=408015 RepID=A0A0F7CNB3_9ACTN|nr:MULTISPECIES: dsRBD fold-containing protein [Streptomyces]AKG42611.1 protein of unknown function (DUF1876) [Streptomyces xiamenensis]MCU4745269.1 DUF1876 domain-containing protein [Streptomyces sp. G-5]QQN79793.1 DUF1876 family protein [Streptomyces sp. XC 2026]